MSCPCRSCVAGKKVVSQAAIAEHLGVTALDLRATIKAGDGPPCYWPGHRAWPRYVVARVDEWLAGRDDRQRGAA